MKIKRKVSTIIASVIASIALTVPGHAAIIINFIEDNGNVIATATGSIIVPNTFIFSFGNPITIARDNALAYLGGGQIALYGGGTNAGFAMNDYGNPNGGASGSGTIFGFESTNLYIPDGTPQGSEFTPTTTWTWESTDLDELGIASLTATPTIVYTASNGETISFASIPEPSSAVLFSVALLALFRRNRGK